MPIELLIDGLPAQPAVWQPAAIYLDLTSQVQWQSESFRVVVGTRGMVRRRTPT